MEDLPYPIPYRRGYTKESSAGAGSRQTLGDNRVMDDQPVTRRELVEALTQHKQELRQELRQDLRQDIQESRREILEGVQELVRDAQTEILKAFLPHAEGTNVRIRLLEATDTGLSERMA
jgi:serine phosphatase RsbU (regulator of sigma subunit)